MGPPSRPGTATGALSTSAQADSNRISDQEARSLEWETTGAESRRAFPRIPCRLLVDYVVDGRAYRDCIANISEGGAFVETSRPVEAGRPITLSFALFQDQQPIKVSGEVAWAGPTGVGVRFHQSTAIGDFTVQEEPASSRSHEVEPPRMSPPSDSGPRETDLPRRRGYAKSAVALPVWVGLVAAAALVLVSRFDTNTRIAALDEKVDRSLQAWSRIDSAMAGRVAQVSSSMSVQNDAKSAVPASPVAPPVRAEKPAADVSFPTAVVPAVPESNSEPTLERTPETIYVVQRGDNLFRIGLRFNVSAQTLIAHNNLARANLVFVGQQIRIPSAESR